MAVIFDNKYQVAFLGIQHLYGMCHLSQSELQRNDYGIRILLKVILTSETAKIRVVFLILASISLAVCTSQSR